MRAARAAACALLASAALAALAGCGGDDPAPSPDPEPPAPGSGLFVGTGPGGIGATLDLEGDDPVAEMVLDALHEPGATRGEDPVVGIASVVNDGTRPLPAPSFVAVLEDGGAAPLQPAGLLVSARLPAAAAIRAREALGPTPRTVPAGGARTMYVVLRGAAAGDVASVRMVVVPGEPITMRARRR